MADRHNAVLEVLQGKATIDQVARRLGVRPETVVGWRDEALEGMTAALQRGDGPSARERELEQENSTLRDALARSAMQVQLLHREWASPPGALLGAGGRGDEPLDLSRRGVGRDPG